MLRYTTDRARPGLIAFYDIRPGNAVGLFLQPRNIHTASTSLVGWDLMAFSAEHGCASGAVVSVPYCLVEVLGSQVGRGTYIENSISEVMSRLGL